jgi:hypothetical protein
MVLALAMTAPIFWTGGASADDPNQGGAPLYCSNSAPYRYRVQSDEWNRWMGECYHLYEILPPGGKPAQSACAQLWSDRAGEFQYMTNSEVMNTCTNPYPY